MAKETVAYGGIFLDPAEAGRLKENLRAFSPELPRNVVQTGEYMK